MAEIVNRIEVIDGAFLLSRPGYYFGYGLESEPDVMDEILGRSVTAEPGVIAVGQQLLVQEIDQAPSEPTEQLGGKSPQRILTDTWREYTDAPFSSHVLRATPARSSTVTGTLYEINLNDGARLAEWNLVLPFERKDGKFFWPGWKAWDHDIELVDGRKVDALTVGEEQQVDRVVDGNAYDPFLNNRQATLYVIRDFAEGFSK